MTKRKGQPSRRSQRLFPNDELRGILSTTYSLPKLMTPPLSEEERRLDEEFESTYADTTELWESIDLLRRIIVEMRAALDDSSTHRAAIDLLGAKALVEARSAYLLVRRGYSIASLGPLRSALEAVDLMVYFRLNPSEVDAWAAEDEKFSSLGWIRKHLPEDPTPLYDFLAYGMHANWRFIPHLLSQGPSTTTNFEIVPGPIRNESYAMLFTLSSIHSALRTLGELHQHHPDCVGQNWRDRYMECVDRSQQLLKDFSIKSKAKLQAMKSFALDRQG